MHYYNLAVFFDDVAKKSGDQTALRYPDLEVKFSELMSWTESFAALLLERGLRKGHVIAIANDKHPRSYALMLAAVRLGIAYVNIDSHSPAARNERILEVSRPQLLFFDDSSKANDMATLGRASSCEVIDLCGYSFRTPSDAERQQQLQMMKQIDGASIAYIMFTSGSTGVPKGVAVTHENVLHFIEWGQTCFRIGEGDIFANVSPMYFDNSVFDFYVGLFSGAALSPVKRELLAKPYDLVAHAEAMKCTIWFSVPSLLIYLMTMKAIGDGALPDLRFIVFGGEGYPKAELIKLFRRFDGRAKLVNVYGPTECTCICSAHIISSVDFGSMEGLPTLGHLNQNFDFKILDGSEKESDSGELCLIGPNVAAGYFNDLERTSASFITLTEPGRFMKRMYRTGDLVQLQGGNLYFVGRKDNQIKHMGYRIELEEIEHALMKLPQVNQAAVIYQRKNVGYGKLVAFVASQSDLQEKDVSQAVAKLLPEYMIPSKILIYKELPKNQNGKIDRQYLATLN